MSLYPPSEDGHLAKLDEQYARDADGRRFLDYERADWERLEAQQQDDCESIEAEERRWSERMRGAAADRGGEVVWNDRMGLDRRLHDVSGMRSVSGL